MNSLVIVPALAGVVTGVIITILIIVSSGQSMTLKENQVHHNFEEAVELVETTVKLKGWTIPGPLPKRHLPLNKLSMCCCHSPFSNFKQ